MLSAIEDIKNGNVLGLMYGLGQSLLFHPPHVIVSSNFALDYKALSGDRWEVYTIGKDYRLKSVSISEFVKESDQSRRRKN